MTALLLALHPAACAAYAWITPTHADAHAAAPRRALLRASQQPPWPVPGPPPDFDGAQWAPWQFGTTLKPPPTEELRQPSTGRAVAAPATKPVAAPAAPAAAVAPPPSAAPAAPPGFFKVTLITPNGEIKIDCPQDAYLLDHVDEIVDENEALADLPYACRAGSCSACAAKLISGEVDNSDGSFLSEEQRAQGFVLTCTSYIKSDVVLKTHAEDDLF